MTKPYANNGKLLSTSVSDGSVSGGADVPASESGGMYTVGSVLSWVPSGGSSFRVYISLGGSDSSPGNNDSSG